MTGEITSPDQIGSLLLLVARVFHTHLPTMDSGLLAAIENSQDYEQLKAAIKRKLKYLKYDTAGANKLLTALIGHTRPLLERYFKQHERTFASLNDRSSCSLSSFDASATLTELEKTSEKLFKFLSAVALVCGVARCRSLARSLAHGI